MLIIHENLLSFRLSEWRHLDCPRRSACRKALIGRKRQSSILWISPKVTRRGRAWDNRADDRRPWTVIGDEMFVVAGNVNALHMLGVRKPTSTPSRWLEAEYRLVVEHVGHRPVGRGLARYGAGMRNDENDC